LPNTDSITSLLPKRRSPGFALRVVQEDVNMEKPA